MQPRTLLSVALLSLWCFGATLAQSTTVPKCPGLSITAEQIGGNSFNLRPDSKYGSTLSFFRLTVANNGPNRYDHAPNGIKFNMIVTPAYSQPTPTFPLLVNLAQIGDGSFRPNSNRFVIPFQSTHPNLFTSPPGHAVGQSINNYAVSMLSGSTSDITFEITDCTILTDGTSSDSASSDAPLTTTGTSSTCSTISMSQTIANQWQGGVQRTVTITNTGTHPIRALDLLATDPYPTPNGQSSITQLWGMTDAGASHYTLPSYTTAIAVGGSIQFGYVQNTFESVVFTPTSISCN